MFIKLNYFDVYDVIIQLHDIQVQSNSQSGQLLAKNVSSTGMAFQARCLVFVRTSFLYALGGSRNHESGKDAIVISGTVLSFYVGVRVSPPAGLRTIASLVGIVIFVRPGSAAGVGNSRKGVS